MAKKTKATSLPTIEAVEERRSAHYRTQRQLDALLSVTRPASKVTLSQWADRWRILSSESSAEPGQWITAKAPYEKAIMDAISDPEVPRVCVQKASQVGITDSCILNPCGYFMTEDPCPILIVQPTIELAEAFSTDRLSPMIRDSPRLRGMVGDPRSRSGESSNTLRRKAFKGGYIALGGANSAASLSGRPVRLALLDEVDRYPASAGTEGDPIQLAIARTSAFWNRKAVIVSSPGTRGVSHIEREMDESTQEHWYLPCPKCGFHQILDWDRIRFVDMKHRCLQCNKHYPKFKWLMGEGEWRPHRPYDERGNRVLTRGFYISGLVNPWVEWDILREEFVRAVKAYKEGDVEPLKAFRNTRQGFLWEDVGEKVDIDLYRHRREVYNAEVPDGVLVLTAGVDVGEYTLHYEVVGWGKGKECWGIEYGTLDGDPRERDVWRALDELVFYREFHTRDKRKMRVRKLAVDSGHAADYVYAYTKARQPRAISIKGQGGLGLPFVKGAGTVTKGNRARLQILGVDSGKEEIVNRLIVDKVGPGYCHFPMTANKQPTRGYDEEYFKGLTAERRVVKAKLGFRTYIWTKRLSQRNEPFDCRNYALGALAITPQINLDTMKRDEWTPSDTKAERPRPFGARQLSVASEQRPPPKARFGAQNRPIS